MGVTKGAIFRTLDIDARIIKSTPPYSADDEGSRSVLAFAVAFILTV